MRKLWWHREFIILEGWRPWTSQEVEITAETKEAYKVRYKWGFFTIKEWVRKKSNSDYFEDIKEVKK